MIDRVDPLVDLLDLCGQRSGARTSCSPLVLDAASHVFDAPLGVLMDAPELPSGRAVAQVNCSLLALQRSKDIGMNGGGMLLDAVNALMSLDIFSSRFA